MRIAQAAEIVLKESSGPMLARDIAAAIAARKLFEFKTADIASVVAKALRNSKKFNRAGGGLFELRAGA